MADFIREAAQQAAEAESGARKLAIAGYVAGLVPLFVSYRQSSGSSSQVVRDGTVISSSSTSSTFDYIAVPAGAVAVLLGAIALFGALRTADVSPKWRGITGMFAAGALALGAYQIAHGAGML